MFFTVRTGIEKVVTAFAGNVPYEIYSPVSMLICFVLIGMAIFFMTRKIIMQTGTHNTEKSYVCMGCAFLLTVVYLVFGLTIIDREQLIITDYQYNDADNSITLQLVDNTNKIYSQDFILPDGEEDPGELFKLNKVNTSASTDKNYLQVEHRYNGNYVYTLTCEEGTDMNKALLEYYEKIETLGTGKNSSEKTNSYEHSYSMPWLYSILYR